MYSSTIRFRRSSRAVPGLVFLVGALLALTGCAGQQLQPQEEAVFFPPPPAQPRVQFLGSISDSRDVEGRQSGFSLLVVGETEADEVKFIVKPYGVAVQDGVIYVCDTITARVVVVDLKQRTFDYLKGNYGFGKLKKPINLTLDVQGNLYVADAQRGEVMVYGPDGNFLRALGRKLGMKPTDVGVYQDYLYVNDFKSSEVKILDRRTGELLGAVGSDGEGPDQRLSLPTNLAVDSAGALHVTNLATGRVMQLDRDGHVLHVFGRLGDAFGEFGRPKGIDVDRQGRVFVVDAAHQNVQIFNAEGRILLFFGDPGSPAGALDLPAGIEVVEDDLEVFQQLAHPDFEVESVVLVTSQFGQEKVNIYGLGHLRGSSPGAAEAPSQL